MKRSVDYRADYYALGVSLFELLATTRTARGSDQLADWLLAPADPAAIRARSACVRAPLFCSATAQPPNPSARGFSRGRDTR